MIIFVIPKGTQKAVLFGSVLLNDGIKKGVPKAATSETPAGWEYLKKYPPQHGGKYTSLNFLLQIFSYLIFGLLICGYKKECNRLEAATLC